MKKIYVTFAISLFFACTLHNPMASAMVITISFLLCCLWMAVVMEKRERDGKL